MRQVLLNGHPKTSLRKASHPSDGFTQVLLRDSRYRPRERLQGTSVQGAPAGTYAATAFHGHLDRILDEDSASDGDVFPYRFRDAGLGPLNGTNAVNGS